MTAPNLDTRGWADLGCAIARQAAADWLMANKKLKKDPYHLTATRLYKDCDRFFHSEWCECVCGVEGSAMLYQLRRQTKPVKVRF